MTPRFVAPCNVGGSDVEYIYVPRYLESDTLTHLTGHLYVSMLHDMTTCQRHRFHLLCDPCRCVVWRGQKLSKSETDAFSSRLFLRHFRKKKPACDSANFVPAQDFAVGALWRRDVIVTLGLDKRFMTLMTGHRGPRWGWPVVFRM